MNIQPAAGEKNVRFHNRCNRPFLTNFPLHNHVRLTLTPPLQPQAQCQQPPPDPPRACTLPQQGYGYPHRRSEGSSPGVDGKLNKGMTIPLSFGAERAKRAGLCWVRAKRAGLCRVGAKRAGLCRVGWSGVERNGSPARAPPRGTHLDVAV